MRAIRRVRLFGVLVLVVIVVLLAAWYFTFISERERYLVSRNVRILTTIATQVDSAIAAQERMFRTFLRSGSGVQWFTEEARREVPSLELVDASRLPGAVPGVDFTPTSRVAIEGRNVWLLLSFAAKGRPDLATREVRLVLGGLLEPIFMPEQGDHAFDALVLASSEGRVLHAIGAQSADLTLTRLEALRPAPSRRFMFGPSRASAPSPTFKTIGATTGLLDVEIAGTAYKLFSQPCCLVTSFQGNGGGRRRPVALEPCSGWVSERVRVLLEDLRDFTRCRDRLHRGDPFVAGRLAVSQDPAARGAPAGEAA